MVSFNAGVNYLPADGMKLLDLSVHVFQTVEGVDDSVDFESDFVVATPTSDSLQTLQVLVGICIPTVVAMATDQLVRFRLETVARYGQNVQVFSLKTLELII